MEPNDESLIYIEKNILLLTKDYKEKYKQLKEVNFVSHS